MSKEITSKENTYLPSVSVPESNTITTPSPIIFLKSCKEISIRKFRECLCNGNISVLIVSGEPEQEDLLNNWADVVFEYSTLLKSQDSSYLMDLDRMIIETELDITYVDHVLLYLKHRYNQQYIDKLVEMGFSGKYNFDDHVQYLAELDRVHSLIKTRIMDLEDYRAERKRYNDSKIESGSNGGQSEDEFNDGLARLGRFMGFRIDVDDNMATDYASMINEYMVEINRISKQKENHG